MALSKITNDGVTGLTINSSGQILTPSRPSFSVTQVEASTVGAQTNQYSFNTVNHNVGSHWDTTNNNKFVAPIAGLYHFAFAGLGCNSAGSPIASGSAGYLAIEKSTDSGSNWTPLSSAYTSISSSAFYPNLATSVTASLAANDYVRLYVWANYVYSHNASNQRYNPVFSGFLVG